MTKPISKIAVTMKHGQMFHNIARNGRPKTLTAPAPAHGMTRQTKPSHEFLHGQAVNDETLEKNWHGKGNVKTHPGMFTKPVNDDPHRGSHDPNLGNAVLKEAGRLGRPKE